MNTSTSLLPKLTGASRLYNTMLGGLAAAFITASATATPIVLNAWNTNGNSGVTADGFQSQTVATNVLTSELSRGSGITASSLANGFAANGWDSATSDTNKYFEFFVEAGTGFDVSLSSIEYRTRRSGTGPSSLRWAYSLNGVDFNDIGSDIAYSGTTDGFVQTPIALGAIGDLQNRSGRITFRLYGWGASGSGGTLSFGRSGATNDDLVVLGTVQADGAPLALASLSPSNGTVDVPINTSLSATFNKSIQAGTGDIELYDGVGLVEAFTVNSSMISGSTITVTPTSPLDTETAYYVLIDDGAIQDTDSDPFGGITSVTDWAFTTGAPIDTTPVISSLSPADGAFDVSVDTDLVIVFDPNVNKGIGNIEIYNGDTDILVQTIDIDDLAATLVGDTLTIELNTLDYDTTYYVLIDSGIVKNDDEEIFAGITAAFDWFFTTGEPIDTTPVVFNLAPANGQSFVSIDTDLVIVFNQNVNAGTGNVGIYNAATDTLVESVAVASSMITGDTLTIELTDPLDLATTYYVLVDAGIVENDSLEAFAGIISNSEWVFTTAIDGYFIDFEGAGETKGSYATGNLTLSGLNWELAETLIGTAASDIKNGARAARIRNNGSMTMVADKPNGLGTISFLYARSDFSGDRAGVSPTFVVEYSTNGGGIWTQAGSAVSLAGVDTLTEFSETVNVGGDIRVRIVQTAGDTGKRWNVDDITLTNFSPTSLEIATLSPENNATGVLIGADLSVSFNQPIQTGTGDLVLYNQDDGVVETFAVISSMISGSTLTVTPSSPLTASTSYYVLLDSGAVEDLSASPFAGISDSTTWTFLVGSPDGSGVAVASNATAANPYDGSAILGRGLTDQSVSISLNADANLVTLADIEITVPSDMGEPSSVVLTGAGSTGASSNILGQTITIENAAVTNVDDIVVTINGLVTPSTFGAGDYGARTFDISTAAENGTLTPIASSPLLRVTLPIALLREVDIDGVPVALGEVVAVEGVALHDNFGTFNTQSNLQDSTAGIAIFNNESTSPFVRGNRYGVVGPIGQFNGLTQVNYGGAANVIDLGPDTEPTPLVLSVTDLLASAENYEGSLVTVANLSYVSGTWGSAQTLILEDADNNQLTIRIQGGSTATTEPVYPVTITGVVSQFDPTSPFNTSYQLMPRDPADLAPGDTPPPANDFAAWIDGFSVGVLTGPNDNPSGDGIPNLLKHILGLNPELANNGPVVEVSEAGAGTITFVHNLAKDIADDVTYGYEWSTDLATWTANGGSEGGVTVEFTLPLILNDSDVDFDVVEVTATVTAGTAGKLFVRLTGDQVVAAE